MYSRLSQGLLVSLYVIRAGSRRRLLSSVPPPPHNLAEIFALLIKVFLLPSLSHRPRGGGERVPALIRNAPRRIARPTLHFAQKERLFD